MVILRILSSKSEDKRGKKLMRINIKRKQKSEWNVVGIFKIINFWRDDF